MKQYINHLYFKIKVAFFYWGVWLINQLIRPNCLDVKNIPIIINNRNRLTYMKMLISSLEKRGYNNIYIIDNDSTYPPLLDYYSKECIYPVFYLNKNVGYNALWDWNFLIFLIRKSKEIDILLRIHFTFMTALFVLLYKMINPKGITAVKLDGYLDPLFFSSDSLSLFKRLKHKVFFRTLRQVDLLTVETQCLYDRLYKEFIDVYDIKLKLVLMPNGFDEETLKTLSIVEKDFGHKENIMITVGRLGTYQKNTEMLLNALDLMELRDWKVYLIGSISEDLDFFLKDFFMRNPSKKESVFFVGPIYDKKSLWEFYNRAKVFILTSRFEGYPLVLTEAKRFRNYIVSTELDASEDLLENGKYGCLIAQENYKELALFCQKIINGEICIDVYENYDKEDISWDMIMRKQEKVMNKFL